MVAECIQCFARVTTITYEKGGEFADIFSAFAKKDQENCLNIIYS